jgi:hypothetical protein
MDVHILRELHGTDEGEQLGQQTLASSGETGNQGAAHTGGEHLVDGGSRVEGVGEGKGPPVPDRTSTRPVIQPERHAPPVAHCGDGDASIEGQQRGQVLPVQAGLSVASGIDLLYCMRSYGIWEAFILVLGISYGCSYLRTARVCSNVHLSKIFIYNLWLSRVHNLGIICSCCCSQGVPTGALELSLFNRTLQFLILVHQYQLIAIFKAEFSII